MRQLHNWIVLASKIFMYLSQASTIWFLFGTMLIAMHQDVISRKKQKSENLWSQKAPFFIWKGQCHQSILYPFFGLYRLVAYASH